MSCGIRASSLTLAHSFSLLQDYNAADITRPSSAFHIHAPLSLNIVDASSQKNERKTIAANAVVIKGAINAYKHSQTQAFKQYRSVTDDA